jgi:RecG-like helicase
MYTGDTLLSKLFKISPEGKKVLEKMGLLTARNLLDYFPVRYSHVSMLKTIDSLGDGDYATIHGVLKK